MLAALNIGAVVAGVAGGVLAASIVGFGLAGALSILGVESGADVGLVLGILIGLLIGGWLAGTRARHSERFHGSVTGLVMAFVIMVIAVLGGSPAPTSQILLMALLAVLIAGGSGWLAGRRKQRVT
ncbi:MAG: hypothetical protein WBM90_11050 [Acidimicrobiia bacterium]